MSELEGKTCIMQFLSISFSKFVYAKEEVDEDEATVVEYEGHSASK